MCEVASNTERQMDLPIRRDQLVAGFIVGRVAV